MSKALEVTIGNISYLEVAYDSYNKLKRYQQLHSNSNLIPESYHPFTYKPVNKIKVSSLHNGQQYIIGQQGNGKVISIYNKTKANEDQNKPYVTAWHAANGLDIKEQIDRIELRLFNNFIKKYSIQLKDLTTQQGLESIFLTYCKDSLSYYDLRTEYYDNNRNKKYERLDLIDFSTFIGKELVKLPTTTITNATTTRNTKIAYKKLFNNYVAGSVSLNTLQQYISDKNNLLTENSYDPYNGNIIAEDSTREAYKHYTRLLVKNYKGNPTPEAIANLDLTTIEANLFYGLEGFGEDLNPNLDYMPFLTGEDMNVLQAA